LVEAFIDEKVLLQPLHWRVGIRDQGSEVSRARRIFVQNQSDLFAEWVTDEMLDQAFAVMALCPQHIFQVLTKRPERMRAFIFSARNRLGEIIFVNALRGIGGLDPEKWRHSSERPWPLPNVWLGVSVENQVAADKRIPLLLQTPAAKRFLSCEPLLGPINLDLAMFLPCQTISGVEIGNWPDWLIVGGESGPGARPMHPDWARSLRDQCAAAGIPFFFKQWGEWLPLVSADEADNFDPRILMRESDAGFRWMHIGKKASGALLDGVEHKAFPEEFPCP
jgi:protein gp37